MKTTTRPGLLALSPLLLAALAACGGGGGGSPAPAPAPVVAGPPVSVTASNYQTVAVESIDGAGNVVASSNIASFAALTGAQSGRAPQLLPLLRERLPGWLTDAMARPATLAGAVVQDVIPCDTGNIRVSINDANGNTVVDIGETIAMSFNNCSLTGATLTGNTTFTATSQPIGLGTPVFSMSLALVLDNLTISSSLGAARTHGSLSFSSSRSAPGTGRDVIGSSAVVTTETVGSVTRTRTLTGFTAQVDLLNNQESLTFAGTLTSSELAGGSVRAETLQPLVTPSGGFFPVQGVVRSTGANGSKAWLTALDGVNVLIEVDINGDALVDQSTQRTWASLF